MSLIPLFFVCFFILFVFVVFSQTGAQLWLQLISFFFSSKLILRNFGLAIIFAQLHRSNTFFQLKIGSDGRCFLAAWAVSKSVHCCLNDRPKPNLPKQKGIHPFRCSVWIC